MADIAPKLFKPARIRLSRARGFNLQRLSMETNGLPAVKVDRSTIWGNPFTIGSDIPMIPGRKVQDRRHSYSLYLGFAPLNEKLVKAARSELSGKNLACWCDDGGYPEDQCCHAHALLQIANATEAPNG